MKTKELNIKAYEIYHVFHICPCGKPYTHSQGDFEIHKQHGQPLEHKSYPIDFLQVYRDMWNGAVTKDRFLHPDIARDLLVSKFKNRFKNYKEAHNVLTNLVFDLDWNFSK